MAGHEDWSRKFPDWRRVPLGWSLGGVMHFLLELGRRFIVHPAPDEEVPADIVHYQFVVLERDKEPCWSFPFHRDAAVREACAKALVVHLGYRNYDELFLAYGDALRERKRRLGSLAVIPPRMASKL